MARRKRQEKQGGQSRWWELTPAAAAALQRELAGRVRQEELAWSAGGGLVAGADAAFSTDGQWCLAAVVVLRYPKMELVCGTEAAERVTFPYVPGLLSFREAPAVLAAYGKLAVRPDVLLVDGQGLAHPRRFGLACHLGVELDVPTIGCAKSLLVGEHRAVGSRRGRRCRLWDAGEVVGMAVRTREGVKCIYVSVGHRVRLEEAARVVLRCCKGYRLPEPTRLAHRWVTRLRARRPMDMGGSWR